MIAVDNKRLPGAGDAEGRGQAMRLARERRERSRRLVEIVFADEDTLPKGLQGNVNQAEGRAYGDASLADMNYVIHDLKRGELWYSGDQAVALALLGDRAGSLAALHKAMNNGAPNVMWPIEIDPAFAAMRGEAEVQAMVKTIGQIRVREHQMLGQLRAAGRLPQRGSQSAPLGPAAK